LFPSSYEAFALASLQAAAAGLPLIATRVHGMDEFMTNGETGWIVERDPKAIAAAITDLSNDREHAAAMGREAVKRAAEYSEAVFLSRWRDLLDRMWREED
jgi:UDP-glucose:(heptosyl)LPS alpha-1,3-glucosyltransferase